ncbi:MAG: hypothetical protein GY757_32525, partial [bacterium]|nr:hypothetical protein [bacterium]
QTEERGKVQAEKEYIYSKDKLEDDSSPDETLEVDFQWAKKKLAADRKKRRVREESLLQEINREAAADLPPLFDTEREIFTLSAARKEIRRLNRQMEKNQGHYHFDK